jgi:hypothetical protein
MKLKIDISNGSQLVECSGHPLELLMELTTFFVRQKECSHLLKYSIKLAEISEQHVKDGGKHDDLKSRNHKEGSAVIAEFMKHYANGTECECENCKPKS